MQVSKKSHHGGANSIYRDAIDEVDRTALLNKLALLLLNMLHLVSATLVFSWLLAVSRSSQEVWGYGSLKHTLYPSRVITDEFSDFVEDALYKSNVRGLSLGIVRSDGSTEFGAWGDSTERNGLVDADVSSTAASFSLCVLTAISDAICDRLMHKGNA